MSPAKTPKDIEWSQRTLCSDGNCIGIIGPDGCCKECGKPFEGKLPFEAATPDPETALPETAANDTEAGTEVDTSETEVSDDDDEWANRILCRDETCIGIIGPDGRCKDCGLALEGKAE